MDDRDRIDEVEGAQPDDPETGNEGVPIPSRILQAVDDIKSRVRDEIERERDVVREYEERYHASRPDELDGVEMPPSGAAPSSGTSRRTRKTKTQRRSYPVNVDRNERKWAALAHASTLLTALVALSSCGLGVLLTMFVPLFIFFAFRNRSDFVAFHALQAFTIQLIGTIGWLALVITGTVIWVALVIVAALLILALIGIVLLPLVILAYPVFILLSLALPLGMVIYSVIATLETWNGHHYRYPYIARWVESQVQSTIY